MVRLWYMNRDNSFVSFLLSLGLSEKAAKVYITLLQYAPQHITGIARLTKIRRASLSAPLQELKKLGLIQASPVGRRVVYYAESPEKLETLWEQQIKKAKQTLSEFGSVYAKQHTPGITLFRGTQGYITLFDDIAARLKRGDVFYRYSARRLDERRFRISSAYKKARQHKHLTRYVITGEAKGRTKRPRLDRFVKTVPASFDLFEDNVSQIIYENRVALIDHETDTTILITSTKLAAFQKKLFLLLWNFLDTPKFKNNGYFTQQKE